MSTGKALSLLAPLATGGVKYWYKRARSRSIINQLFKEGFLDDKGDIRRWGDTVGNLRFNVSRDATTDFWGNYCHKVTVTRTDLSREDADHTREFYYCTGEATGLPKFLVSAKGVISWPLL